MYLESRKIFLIILYVKDFLPENVNNWGNFDDKRDIAEFYFLPTLKYFAIFYSKKSLVLL